MVPHLQVASTRYASHLSSCLRLGSSRRGAARTAITKTKYVVVIQLLRRLISCLNRLASEAGRSASPYTEAGNLSDDGKTASGKAKLKSKAKRTGKLPFAACNHN